MNVKVVNVKFVKLKVVNLKVRKVKSVLERQEQALPPRPTCRVQPILTTSQSHPLTQGQPQPLASFTSKCCRINTFYIKEYYNTYICKSQTGSIPGGQLVPQCVVPLVKKEELFINIAIGETSPAITSFHFFGYSNSSTFYHQITSITC